MSSSYKGGFLRDDATGALVLSGDFSGLSSVDSTAKTDGYEPYWDGGGLVLKGSPPKQLDVRRKGAKGDVLTLTDGVMTSGSNQLTSASVNSGGGFSSVFLDVGRAVHIRGAGALTARGTGNTAGTTNQVIAATGWYWMPGMWIAGTGVPANTEVIAVDGIYGNQTLTLSKNLTGAGAAGTALSTVGSVNGYISTNVTGGIARVVTAPGGSTAVNATTTVAGATVRYGTDDTAAIAATYALAALTGHDVGFSPGGYWCSSITVNIPNVRFTSSKGARIYQLGGFTDPLFFRSHDDPTSSLTNVEFEGLDLEGDPTLALSTPSTVAIYLNGPNLADVRVRGCRFTRFRGCATSIYQGRDIKVSGNFAKYVCSVSGYNAFNFTDSSGSAGGGGVTQSATWQGAGNWTASDNTVEHCASAGIAMVTFGQGRTLGTSRGTITGNTLRTCGWVGIAGETNGGQRWLTISGNGINDCAGGVQVSNTSQTNFSPGYNDHRDIAITGNTISSNYAGAFGILASCSNQTIASNTIRVPARAISFGGQSTSSRAYNQTITGNTLICCNTNAGALNQLIFGIAFDGASIMDNTLAVEHEFDRVTVTGATAGTFTLTVVDPLTSTTYGPTAGIAFNASAAAVQAAIVAVLPGTMADAALATSGGDDGAGGAANTLASVPVDVMFTRKLGGRAVTLTGNFTGLTGATTATVTQIIGGAVCHNAIQLDDTARASVKDNTIYSPGRAGIALTNCRDGEITDNAIYDPNATNNAAAGVGVGISHTGDVGTGLTIARNRVQDRRGTPLMRYAVYLAAGASTGTPVWLTDNKLLGAATADVNDRSLVALERNTQDRLDGSVRNQGGAREDYGTAAPTTGAYLVGDKRWNSAPVAGGPVAWICTTAGSPGTWQPLLPGGTAVVNAGNLGATYTLDCTNKPDVLLTCTLTANCTITVSNMAVGQSITVQVAQDGTGSRTLAFSPTAKKPGGVALGISTAASAVDVISAYSPDGTTLYAMLAGKAMA